MLTGMKHFPMLMVFAALAASPALRAQDLVWPASQVCGKAQSRLMEIELPNGDTVQGTCFRVDVNEMQIETKSGIVSIARSQLSRVRVLDLPRHHQLAHLGGQVRRGLRESGSIVPTPMGVFGLIGMAGTLGYGAAGLPFAAIGDLFGYTKSIEIQIK